MRDAGKLLSGSDDKLVCEWDLYKTCQSDSTGAYLTALRTYQGHQDVVEDVDWHPDQKNIFASVGDDKVIGYGIVWYDAERTILIVTHLIAETDSLGYSEHFRWIGPRLY